MLILDGGRTEFITRGEWGAAPPQASILNITPNGNAIHWEGPHMGFPWDHAACYSLVRGIQAFHMGASRGWSDIAYNAIVCPHGYTFEGRWIPKRSAANGTNVANAAAYAVCYLAGQEDEFTDAAKRAIRDTCIHLQNHGGAGGELTGHRDWYATACPGDEIFNWVHASMPVGPDALMPPPGQSDTQPTLPDGGRPLLAWGARGPDVEFLQNFLKAGGWYSGEVDGDFRNLTAAAVEAFQGATGLTVDAVVGPQTWQKINDIIAWVAGLQGGGNSGTPIYPDYPLPQGHWFGSESSDPRVHSGYYTADRDQLAVWQTQMASRGWAINTDGRFTAKTGEIAKKFQLEKNLAADGLVGPETWAAAWTAPVT